MFSEKETDKESCSTKLYLTYKVIKPILGIVVLFYLNGNIFAELSRAFTSGGDSTRFTYSTCASCTSTQKVFARDYIDLIKFYDSTGIENFYAFIEQLDDLQDTLAEIFSKLAKLAAIGNFAICTF